ncbi:MAG: hypothetical protein AB1763_07725 [Campylobacterota bacterium]
MNETLRTEILRHARAAFERACTLRENERLEVYLHEGKVITTDVLDETESLVYGTGRILCYEVWGHDYLEEEIAAWIDQARFETDPKALEQSIRETLALLAARKGITDEEISSYEVFANLRMEQIEQIEHAIIDYWWDNRETENAKSLALAQIDAALRG